MSTLAAGRSRSYGGGGLAIARILKLIAGVVAAIIVVGILLVLLEAKPANDIVAAITDAARWLAGPFRGIFSFDSHKLEVAVNWGLAAAIYYAVAALIARFAART
jgi:hypothetical protein